MLLPCMVALGDTFVALVCVLALSHSGRYERAAACTLLLCAGSIAGCSAVLAMRRYYCYESGLGVCLRAVRKSTA